MSEVEYKPIAKYKVNRIKSTHIPGAPVQEETQSGYIPRSKLNEEFLTPNGALLLSKKTVNGVMQFIFRKELLFFGFERFFMEVIPVREPVKKEEPNPRLLKFSLSYYGIDLGAV